MKRSNEDSSRPNEAVVAIWSDAILEEDVLGFREKARALADLLSSPRAQTPLCVGVFSPSGGGKTTFLRLLAEALSEQSGMHILWFDLTYQPVPEKLALGLARAIISALVDALPQEELSKLDSLCSSLSERGGEAKDEFLWAEVRRGLERLLETPFSGQKLCVLLDDAHLVSAEGLSQLLTAVTSWLALPGLIFVVAADMEVLLHLMEERERRVAGELPEPAIAARARAVLDKLVQLSLSLPGPGREEVLRHWRGLAPDVEPELVLAAASQPGMNVRRLKQLANHFRFLTELARVSGVEVKPEVLLKFLMIRSFWEDVWRAVSAYLEEKPSPLMALQEIALGRVSFELLSVLEKSPFLKRCRDDLHLMTLLRMPPHLTEEETERACSLIKMASPREDEQAQVVSDLVSGDPFRVRLAASVVSRMGSVAREALISELLHRAERADMVGKGKVAYALWAVAHSIPAVLMDEVQGFLEGLFRTEEPEPSSQAVRAAARICSALDPEASSRLEAKILSLKEERYEVSVRAAVAAGLAELGENISPHRAERAIAVLLSLTQDLEPMVRREAVRGLLTVRPPGGKVGAKVADRLLELMHDSDERVVAGAAEGLVQLLPELDEGRKELAGISLTEAVTKAGSPLKELLLSALERSLPHLPLHQRGRAEQLFVLRGERG